MAAHLMAVLREGVETIFQDDLDVPRDPLQSARATVATLEQSERQSAADRLAKLDAAGEARDAEYLLIRRRRTPPITATSNRSTGRGRPNGTVSAQTLRGARRLYRAFGTLGDLGFTVRAAIWPRRSTSGWSPGHRDGASADQAGGPRLERDGADHLRGGPPIPGGPRRQARSDDHDEPTSRSDVERRYGDRVSIIASAIAGAARPAHRPNCAQSRPPASTRRTGPASTTGIKVETGKGSRSRTARLHGQRVSAPSSSRPTPFMRSTSGSPFGWQPPRDQ